METLLERMCGRLDPNLTKNSPFNDNHAYRRTFKPITEEKVLYSSCTNYLILQILHLVCVIIILSLFYVNFSPPPHLVTNH